MNMSTSQSKDTELSTAKVLPTRYPSSVSDKVVTIGTSATAEHVASDPKGTLGLNLLYAPAEPLVDFIFVHGLGGGSRKTWSKTRLTKDYWPQEWLPRDPAFCNVRIYSFGYNSDWSKGKKNCLNIHHFGKSLLGSMNVCPDLRDGCTPIVFIGHSMGGLVIKKAYNIAMQEAIYESLAKRVQTIYFLATPHNGSDSAKLLSAILDVASLSRDFVGELKKDSGTIQGISDEFRNYSADLDLWSFYETSVMGMKPFSRIIVTPDSAVLGFHGEKQIPMNADHRSICKFDSTSDPNYITVRNSLETTVVEILSRVRTTQQQSFRDHIKDLESYLGLPDKVENELDAVKDARISGTCEWFSQKRVYQKWKDFEVDAPTILWVAGMPAAGKSILAGYAIDELGKPNAACSYFFFKYGDESKSRLAACLRSLAFQMACGNLSIRTKLLEMQREDVKFDKDNERTVWRKLFLSGIFKTKFPRHYWVIDALDECITSGAIFDLIIGSFDASVPLRILITSRKTGDLEKSFKGLTGSQYQVEELSISDTFPDIKRLIQMKAKSFNVKSDAERNYLVERILKKSNGSFLWAALVSDLLSNSHTKEQIDRVLDDVPEGMEPFYQRTLDIMSRNTYGRELTSAILIWVVCTTRPLSLIELDGALKLDVKDAGLSLKETIVAFCGQIVIIDKYGTVQMVHETAREFLLDVRLNSEFAIETKQAHTRIAKSCLIYLTGDEMKPPRSGRRQSTVAVKTGFAAYAFTTFSYHLSKADACSDELLALVIKFLKMNVLSWIEVIAHSKDLLPLIRVAKNLRSYLTACSAERSPLSQEISLIKGWTTDLIRITAKFSDALVQCPSAIYSLILPFCPTSSSIYKTANNGRRITVIGLSNPLWDDRMSCIDFHQAQTSAICTGDHFLVVGLTSGMIHLYHAASYQEYRTFNHGESVKFLMHKPKSDLMASCGMKNIRIWNVHSGEIVYSFKAPQRPICLAFGQDTLMVASHQNSLATWDLEHDGTRRPDKLWNESLEQSNTQLRRPPCAIAISIAHRMLAVAYSGKPILLWDLAENTFYGNYGRKLPNGETSTHIISALIFNPNINIGLMVVSYLDGQLALLDPFNDQEITSVRAGCVALASSHDGRLLAGGAGSGIIQVYEFDTLRLLYRVKSSNFYIKQLAFSADGLHLVDIRGSQCNVWEPAILLRDMVGDDSSVDSSASAVEVISSDSNIKISALTLLTNAEVVFCGKEDGSVCVYSLRTGHQMEALYSHKSLVRILTWCPLMDVIISIDTSNTVFAWKLKLDLQRGCVVDRQLFHCRLDCGSSIIQVLAGEMTGKLILSTRESTHFWNFEGCEEEVRLKRPGIGKWIQHPQSQFHMICIDGECAHIYSWVDCSEVASISLHLDNLQMDKLQLKRIVPFIVAGKSRMVLEFCELNGSVSTQKIHVIDTAAFKTHTNSIDTDKEESAKSPKFQNNPNPGAQRNPHPRSRANILASHISQIIGIGDNGKLVFLDINSWVCSASLENTSTYASTFSYSRHFFMPYDWFSGTRDILCALTRRDVIFARSDAVAIIKGGLEYVENVDAMLEAAPLKGRMGVRIGGRMMN